MKLSLLVDLVAYGVIVPGAIACFVLNNHGLATMSKLVWVTVPIACWSLALSLKVRPLLKNEGVKNMCDKKCKTVNLGPRIGNKANAEQFLTFDPDTPVHMDPYDLAGKGKKTEADGK